MKVHVHNVKSRYLSRRCVACLPACLPTALIGPHYYSLLLALNGSRYAVYSRAKPDREKSLSRRKNSRLNPRLGVDECNNFSRIAAKRAPTCRRRAMRRVAREKGNADADRHFDDGQTKRSVVETESENCRLY